MNYYISSYSRTAKLCSTPVLKHRVALTCHSACSVRKLSVCSAPPLRGVTSPASLGHTRTLLRNVLTRKNRARFLNFVESSPLPH